MQHTKYPIFRAPKMNIQWKTADGARIVELPVQGEREPERRERLVVRKPEAERRGLTDIPRWIY